jgi:hypothetical protein
VNVTSTLESPYDFYGKDSLLRNASVGIKGNDLTYFINKIIERMKHERTALSAGNALAT